MGVTGVLNAAQGTMSGWSYVNTKESYYTRCNIKFLGVPALDVKHYPINEHFQETANFIENILKEKGNSLLTSKLYIYIQRIMMANFVLK